MKDVSAEKVVNDLAQKHEMGGYCGAAFILDRRVVSFGRACYEAGLSAPVQPGPRPKCEQMTWAEETMQIINKMTPDITGKAFDPDWFLLRQRFEEMEKRAVVISAEPPPRKIKTSYEHPPIPNAHHLDWMAYFDGDEEGGPRGHGRTEEEAIADLKENYPAFFPVAAPSAPPPLNLFPHGEGCGCDTCKLIQHVARALTLDLEPLKRECDRKWETETPQHIINIAANAIHWQKREIAEWRGKYETLSSSLGVEQVDEKQLKIDISNLRFYSAMAHDFRWQTDIIHYGVITQTLNEIAARLEQIESLRRRVPAQTPTVKEKA